MRILANFVFFLVFSFSAFAQNDVSWTSVSSKKGDIVLALPSDFIVYNPGSEVTLLSSSGDASFKVSIVESTDGRERLKWSRRYVSSDDGWRIMRYKVGNFEVETQAFEKTNYYLNLYIASSSSFCSISIFTKSIADKTMGSFLMSLLLDQKPLAKSTAPPPKIEKTVVAKDLKTSGMIIEALNHKQKGKIDVQMKEVPDDNSYLEFLYSRQLLVLGKPRPTYTDRARQDNVQGTVVLLVLFKDDGDIGKISVIRSLPGGLTEEAISAAKKIKFLPAEIGEKPADIARPMEYTFSIY